MTTNHAVRGQSALMAGVDSALAAGALGRPAETAAAGPPGTVRGRDLAVSALRPDLGDLRGRARRRVHPRRETRLVGAVVAAWHRGGDRPRLVAFPRLRPSPPRGARRRRGREARDDHRVRRPSARNRLARTDGGEPDRAQEPLAPGPARLARELPGCAASKCAAAVRAQHVAGRCADDRHGARVWRAAFYAGLAAWAWGEAVSGDSGSAARSVSPDFSTWSSKWLRGVSDRGTRAWRSRDVLSPSRRGSWRRSRPRSAAVPRGGQVARFGLEPDHRRGALILEPEPVAVGEVQGAPSGAAAGRVAVASGVGFQALMSSSTATSSAWSSRGRDRRSRSSGSCLP